MSDTGRQQSENEETCFLCLRITPKEVLSYAHKVWKDPEVARKIARKTSEYIRSCYRGDPTMFSGKGGRMILAGFFYLFSLQDSDPSNRRTQTFLAHVFKVNSMTVRNNANNIEKWIKDINLNIGDYTRRWKGLRPLIYLCPVPDCEFDTKVLDKLKEHLSWNHDIGYSQILRSSHFIKEGILTKCSIIKSSNGRKRFVEVDNDE